MELNSEQIKNILHDSARKCDMDGHVVICEKKVDLQTNAERMMGNMSYVKNPHKNSYLYLDSVDACFYIERKTACVTFTARWDVGSKDLSIERMVKAIVLTGNMLEEMQRMINELLEGKDE